MLGRILFGIAGALLGAAVIAGTVCVIHDKITTRLLAQKANENGFRNAVVDMVNRCNNKVSIKELYGNKKQTFEGTSISRDVVEGTILN